MASIEYYYTVNNILTQNILYSCDRYDGCDMPSVTTATGNVLDKVPEIEYEFTCDMSNYTLNTTTTYTLKIENKANIDLLDVGLMIQFPEEFLLEGDITGDLALDNPDDENGDGWYYFSGITLYANTAYTLTFKVKSPDLYDNLPFVCDPDTGERLIVDDKEVIGDLVTEFALTSDGEYDECTMSAFDNVNDNIIIPYRTIRERSAVISNRNATTIIKR